MYVAIEPRSRASEEEMLIPYCPASRPHAPQLPPIQSNMSPDAFYPQNATAQLNAVYNREARSPRASSNSSSNPPQLPPIGRGPVPKFEKVANTADLQPKINAQPPFRRANPEGGFISVSCDWHRTRRLVLIASFIAAASADCSPAYDIQAMQYWFQLPIVPKSSSRPHKAEQGSQE